MVCVYKDGSQLDIGALLPAGYRLGGYLDPTEIELNEAGDRLSFVTPIEEGIVDYRGLGPGQGLLPAKGAGLVGAGQQPHGVAGCDGLPVPAAGLTEGADIRDWEVPMTRYQLAAVLYPPSPRRGWPG